MARKFHMTFTPDDVNVVLNRIELATLREEQTLAELKQLGIGFDKGHAAYERDYGKRKQKNAFNGVMCSVVIGALMWVPVLVWWWRTR